jgi:hypothetical protein
MTMRIRIVSFKSLFLLILATSLVSSIFGIQQPVRSSSDDREADPNDDPITAGWKEGKNDYLNGDPKEYECSSNLPDTYCSLYRSGYEQGWKSQEGLGRAPGSDPQ